MADTDLPVTTEQQADATILRPGGEIDLGRAPSLRAKLSEVLRRKPPRLVVDLSAVAYMDSSCVATLIEALQLARKQQTTFVLCGLQPRVRSIFEIARLQTVFRIEPDLSAALAGSPPP